MFFVLFMCIGRSFVISVCLRYQCPCLICILLGNQNAWAVPHILAVMIWVMLSMLPKCCAQVVWVRVEIASQVCLKNIRKKFCVLVEVVFFSYQTRASEALPWISDGGSATDCYKFCFDAERKFFFSVFVFVVNLTFSTEKGSRPKTVKMKPKSRFVLLCAEKRLCHLTGCPENTLLSFCWNPFLS